ncbi:hypothetical protein [Halomonas organivorans]|uniref:Uncharacterized protein n=1 Tax=Halomonas organivorans TaxID=257772 RepID=A0A7W5G7B7_9GAMM|nr:hypothetical protein [Halomonas organivorans]MBB3142772.1 hypothetical protein [Halomonas organivorans]
MTATSHLRGHPIAWDALRQHWVYCDTGEPTVDTWQDRDCGHCGERETPEGHDACLGTLPGVMNACCGHGQVTEAYVQHWCGHLVRGAAALAEIERLKALRAGED